MTDGADLVLATPRGVIDYGNDAGLGTHETLAPAIDQRVRGTEVDREIVREPSGD